MSNERSEKLQRYLPTIMLLIVILQPVMDVLSYWLTELEIGTAPTLLLRFALLFGTAALGFCLSKRKRAYLLLAAAAVLLAALHGWACITAGYQGWNELVSDLTNFIRVVQIPLFTLCFITFLRETGEEGYKIIERGFVINFSIIVLVELTATVTGTDPHTYANKGIGILGWFYFANSQSAILSAMVPVIMMKLMRKKRVCGMLVGTLVCFAVLYLFATRLSYFAIFVTAAGLILVMLLSRRFDRRACAVLLLGAALCGAVYTISPMHQNQLAQRRVAQQAQAEADDMIADAENQYADTAAEDPVTVLYPVYELYVGELMDRFGTERVMQAYDYTTDVTELKDWRRMKLLYCRYLMEEAGTAAGLFGLEYADMTYEGQSFDAENDLHGLFYLYGAVGLALFLLFLLYFALLIVQALIRNFKKYMTVEAGAFGVSLCLLLVHIYCTAGVLRRPNASFYLSVILAVIYYFVKIKSYPHVKKERSGRSKERGVPPVISAKTLGARSCPKIWRRRPRHYCR